MNKYFLDTKVGSSDKVYVLTYGDMTIHGSVPSSTHMEADYHLIHHIFHGINCGFKNIVVLLIVFFPSFIEECNDLELFINVGAKKQLWATNLLNVNVICRNFGMEFCRGLLFFIPSRGAIIPQASSASVKIAGVTSWSRTLMREVAI